MDFLKFSFVFFFYQLPKFCSKIYVKPIFLKQIFAYSWLLLTHWYLHFYWLQMFCFGNSSTSTDDEMHMKNTRCDYQKKTEISLEPEVPSQSWYVRRETSDIVTTALSGKCSISSYEMVLKIYIGSNCGSSHKPLNYRHLSGVKCSQCLMWYVATCTCRHMCHHSLSSMM